MKVEDLIKQGAKIDVHFHRCKSYDEAYEKLKPFEEYGSIQEATHKGSYWLEIKGDRIEFAAFIKNNPPK
ncbi:hypothetical protein [Virgibacillus doumboii]|uniref:hypothetical protein n=1 Tax=Virgibacillus doumboii TaxID=2697503 RepID=UPI0013E02E7F|nr:hypothetical protein [Virgibacillus doumboii]